MSTRSNNQNGQHDHDDELALIYVHMIYDTTKIGIDAVLRMVKQPSTHAWQDLIDTPEFTLEGLLIDAGIRGLAIYPIIAVRHPIFNKPVLLTAADKDGAVNYFDIECESYRAIVHWNPLELDADRCYPISRLNEQSNPPSLADLLKGEKVWLYESLININSMVMTQDEQVDRVLYGLGVRPEAFYGPDRDIFLHAMKQGLGLTFLPPNII